LVHVTRGGIENPEHWDDTIGLSIGSSDARFIGPNIVDMHPDTPRPFGNLGTLCEGSVNAIYAICLVSDEKARGHLWTGCPGIEECWGGVDEVALGHFVIGL